MPTHSNTIPVLGLGTYGRTGPEGLDALLVALELGYRHLDTAQSYGTEQNVGEAIARSGLPRDEFFVTTKVADTRLTTADFLPSVEKSLETLGLDQVDLLLIHWPSSKDAVPFEDYMTGLAQAKARGWARQIGVSNFPIALLDKADQVIGAGQIATNQIEIHPYLQSPKIRDYAASKGLTLTAYMPLAKGKVSTDKLLTALGEKHDVTAAAIALAFLMAQGHVVIPSSARRERLVENLAARSVTLSPEDLAAIGALDRNERMINPEKSPRWDD